jgi:para-nitrobenzyl esterase
MARGGNRVFMYYFSKTLAERYPAKYGAFHGAEIVYALDNLENDPGPIGSGKISKADQDYADLVSAYWVNFARSGNPNGEGLPLWPEWTAEQEAYLELGEDITTGQFLLKSAWIGWRRFWLRHQNQQNKQDENRIKSIA